MATEDNIAGAPAHINLAGRDFLISPLRDVDYAEFEMWMRAQPLAIARENISRIPTITDREREIILSEAMRISANLNINSMDGAKYLNSLDGAAYLLWLSFRQTDLKIKPQEVKQLILDPRTIEQAMDKFDLVNGMGESKKGVRKGRTKAVNQAVTDVVSSMLGGRSGAKSTDSSPTPISGDQPSSP